ncbi:hypothetical protein M942_00225 [Enterobacter ludwigii]|jgi:type 1 fimbria pilin|uniref:fimbrial protein n=1 Tax=Enterobacter ludwigii TaxID=299767 RepID=UPI0003D91332|nr:type 1 fimbrial protein [Enterobacter ludwigii]AHE72410.1 hypothetical protein M942_00225 [Enterobacter ludwigii]
MKKLFCLAALTTVLGLAASQAAMADQTGQVQFNAKVESPTCTLSGQDMTHDLGAYSIADTAWSSTAYGLLKTVSDTIHVTDCPGSVSAVKVTPTWGRANANTKAIADNEGTAKYVEMVVSTDGAGKKLYTSAVATTFPVASGVAEIPFVQTYRHDNSGTVSTVGDIKFSATLKFDYQ